MKILRVNILNLNSLRGYHPIDFTDEPLANHRLYAIVGPTGAGKTTILDAITLALYGQTERNKSEVDRKDGTGTVLSYGEGECSAEVEYEVNVDGKLERFRSAWTRQRAHKKPTGNLTASRHSIAQFLPDEPDADKQWKILATKKKEVAAKTMEIVGLDYERFVRSVMLTQGDFARFLKSDVGNKAEILEKITGTAIYRDLSIAAFNRAKVAREAHEAAENQLATAPALAEADRQRLDEQYAEKQKQATELRKTLEGLTAQLNAHQKAQDLTAKNAQANTTVTKLEEAWTAAATDRDRLALSDRLQSFRSDLDAEVRLEKEVAELNTASQKAEAEQKLLQEAVAKATQAIEKAQDQLNHYYTELPRREEKIKRVANIERELSGLLRDVETDQKRTNSIKESRRERRSKSQTTEQKLSGIRAALAGMEPAAIQAKLSAFDASIPSETTALQGLREQIEWRQIADRRKVETAKAEASKAELGKAEAVVTQYKVDYEQAVIRLADRRLLLNNLQVSASLADHKHNLKAGEECPVCGATEHPALQNFQPVTESATKQANADVNKALTEEQTAQRKLKEAEQSLTRQQRAYDTVVAIVSELNAQLAGVKATDTDTSLDDLKSDLDRREKQLAADTREQTRLRQLQTRLPEIATLENEATGHRERLAELDKELEQATASLETTQQSIAKKREQIQLETKGLTADQCREKLRQKKEALSKQLADAEKQEVDQKGRMSALKARLKDLTERKTVANEALMATQNRLADGLPAGTTTTAARQSLLSETEALHLRTRLNETQTRLATARTVAQQLREELAAANEAIKTLPSLETLEESKAEQTHLRSTTEQEVGALALQVRQDDDRIKAAAEQQKELAGLRKEMDRWATMHRLIGAADGKKFRSYAQAITLQRLIDVGNDHLRNINPRYRMEYAPPASGNAENLEIIIVDNYHDENRRTVSTLSGGETFLISLALALGLSDLASGRHLIQSLFIDEGFGTLDGKTLDKAMTTLEQLKEQGKTIGLISHVASLQERIQCQIRLEPVGEGFSKVSILD